MSVIINWLYNSRRKDDIDKLHAIAKELRTDFDMLVDSTDDKVREFDKSFEEMDSEITDVQNEMHDLQASVEHPEEWELFKKMEDQISDQEDRIGQLEAQNRDLQASMINVLRRVEEERRAREQHQ